MWHKVMFLGKAQGGNQHGFMSFLPGVEQN
eukprot:SAG11_NODE_8967_length_958_cov_1.123399_2_plen_30_part_00